MSEQTTTREPVVVLGEALIDLVSGDPDERAGLFVKPALGGAPFNVARAAARLGAPVEYVGALSNDRFGVVLHGQLVADGVGVQWVPRTDAATTLALAELTNGAAEYRFYIEATSAPELTASDIAALPSSPAAVVTGGLGLVLEPMVDSVLAYADSVTADTVVIVDVNARPLIIPDQQAYLAKVERLLRRANVVKASDEDLEYLHPEMSIEESASWVLGLGADAVIVTAGAEQTKVLTSDGWASVDVPPLIAPVIDTIGAGDTFVGGLVASLYDNSMDLDGLLDAVAVGNAAAGVVVTRRGADPPTRADLGL